MLAAGLVLTLHGARTMILVIAHQALHRRFSGSARIDRFVGELVTVLNVYQDFRAFRRSTSTRTTAGRSSRPRWTRPSSSCSGSASGRA